MSEIRGTVGKRELIWKSVPRGERGNAQVEVEGETLDIAWRRDRDGIWIEFPYGVYGFDFEGEVNDEGRIQYRLSQRGAAAEWSDLSFKRAGEESASASSAGVKKGMRIRAQMPGKIIRVLAQAGVSVEKDQPLLVMEAMKMENEIRSPQAGKVGQIKVVEGQAVETGADLCVIEPV